ncbi:MAG: methionyl-tRNA formyltransferase [Treponema sp.]|jgi:methionyl-tRNA formyltransferase|nr:methionyl-tRNA formyltransferase [Treponema sp.]
MRIIYAGSPAIAVPALEALFPPGDGVLELAGVLTNPDRPRGRRGRPEPSDVGEAVEKFSSAFPALSPIPVFKFEKTGAEAREAIAVLKPDILVSFAYGRIFGPKFLSLFSAGGINIHPSLLPKYRGPSPIPQAILNRDSETGISVQKLALRMDSGDILLRTRIPLDGRETTESLSRVVAEEAALLLPPLLRRIAAGKSQSVPQDEGEASYCSLIEKDSGRIDWKRSAVEIDAMIRAYTPWPLSWTMEGERKLNILESVPYNAGDARPENASAEPGKVLGVDKKRGILIQTGEGILAVSGLQYQTRKALDFQAFLNGERHFLGAKLE